MKGLLVGSPEDERVFIFWSPCLFSLPCLLDFRLAELDCVLSWWCLMLCSFILELSLPPNSLMTIDLGPDRLPSSLRRVGLSKEDVPCRFLDGFIFEMPGFFFIDEEVGGSLVGVACLLNSAIFVSMILTTLVRSKPIK